MPEDSRVELVSVAGETVHRRGDLAARFPIFSLTKPVIAAALLRVGAVDLEVERLLNHTSGLFDYGRLAEYHAAVAAHPSEPWSDRELLERARARGSVDGWQYSNTGYLLLRRRLEDYGGLASLVHELGFENAIVAEEIVDLVAAVPARSRALGDGEREVGGLYHPRWVGHRSLVTTARELLRFWAHPPAEFTDVRRLVPIGFEAPGYAQPAYGLGVMADRGATFGLEIGHGGGGPGYSHGVFTVPARAAVAIVLTADEAFDAQARARRLLHAALGQPRSTRE